MTEENASTGIRLFGFFAAALGGYPIYQHALADIYRRRMTMELSMTIALLAALLIGEFFTTLVIIFFVLLAEILESLTVDRGRMAIGSLLALLPNQVTVRVNGEMAEVTVDKLVAGSIVVIRPGARIPVDGDVIAGDSYVDQSTITGESIPIEKTTGCSVYAGTFNQSGILEIRTKGVGRDTAFGRIIDTVEKAEQARAPIQKIADRLAGYLVYFAIACAILTFYFSRDARATISVVIVAGACGVAAGTPLAILGAIGTAAREGIIIKGGIPLQLLAGVNTVVLDKTGTITSGRPKVIAIHPARGVTERMVLEAAALAERKSEHTLGSAVIRKADEEGIPAREPERFQYLPGRGIVCSGDGGEIVVGNRPFLESRGINVGTGEQASTASSEIHVAENGRFLGTILLADTVRPEAA
ncbi:MAG: HAD-IC family P-type ATPase, partial [Candidatus Hydrogenedentota bacterium]